MTKVVTSPSVGALSDHRHCGAPCRLDPCRSHRSGLHGVWRELPSQPQHRHAAQVKYPEFMLTWSGNICASVALWLMELSCLLCRCYEMERRLKTPDLFKFPYFEAICWYVAKNLLETLKGESNQYICTNHRCENT